MMLKLLPSAIIALLLLAPSLHAQGITSPTCGEDIYASLANEHRVFRSVMYGLRQSSQEKIGNVRYDKESNPWVKTANNTWKSLSKGYESTVWSDFQMDAQGAAAPRRGIFERKKALTSDVLPEVLQAVRAFQCRMQTVCALADKSLNATTPTVTAQVDGCLEVTAPVLTQCKATPSANEVSINACDTAVTSILNRELKLLELQVYYDSAYRSLLQFAGQLEGFMEDFRLPLLQPLRQTVDVLSGFDGLKCFLSQCDR